MNNYEKIMIAIGAIQRNCYAMQDLINSTYFIMESHGETKHYLTDRIQAMDKELADTILRLKDIMETTGECLNAADCVSTIDCQLNELPYAIINGEISINE